MAPVNKSLNIKIAKICVINELRKLYMENQIQQSRRSREHWVNPFILKRGEMDIENHLLKDLCWDDSNFKNFTRVTKDQFDKILEMVSKLN